MGHVVDAVVYPILIYVFSKYQKYKKRPYREATFITSVELSDSIPFEA